VSAESNQLEVHFEIKAQGAVLNRYMQSRDRVSCIMGPLGSGKTYASCMRLFNQVCEQKPNRNGVRKSRWVAVRNTYSDLESTTIKDWKDLYHNDDMPALGRFVHDSPPTHYLDFDLDDGTRIKAEIVFLALDRPEHVKKLRGLQCTGFWLNEMKELPKAIVDMCDLRHGRYPSAADGGPSWHGMIGDTNAPDDDHWYYDLAEITKPEGWTFFRQPGGVMRQALGNGKTKWVINPKAENLPNLPGRHEYYIRGLQGKKDDWIRVNLANEYGNVSNGKPIYAGLWEEEKHLSSYSLAPIAAVPKIIIGMDFGRTPAAIVCQLMPNGKLRVIKELIATGMGIRSFMDKLVMPYIKTDLKRFKLSDIEIYGDPAGKAKSGNDENSPLGILNDEYKLTSYPTATNDPVRRWESVNTFLMADIDGKPGFELSADCNVLRKGFNGGYQFRRLNVGGEKYADKADKNEYSHPHDALQYAAQGAQGEIDYAWRDQHINESMFNQNIVSDKRTGY
jgi:hypothetical protein